MPRFFVPPESLSGQTVCLSGSDADHIKVLRLRPGDSVTLCDGAGTDCQAKLLEYAPGLAQLELLSRCPSPGEARLRCHVLAGLPKGERSDFIVQKCTENGADTIRFFLSARCVARPDAKSLPRKIERWQRIAEEAAKQSGRGKIPQIQVLPDFSAALEAAKETALPLFLYETGQRTPLREMLSGVKSIPDAAIITGPEGGFDPEEAQAALEAGLRPCSMGPRIFRCETAPLIALTALLYESGDLD